MGNKLITQTEEGKQYISSDLGKTWKFFGDGEIGRASCRERV